MSSQGNGQAALYDVRMSVQTKDAVKNLYRQRIQEGKGQQFVSAFRQIAGRLRRDPLVFGEPLYRLPSLHLQVRQGILGGVLVNYAVHEERPLVFISRVQIL